MLDYKSIKAISAQRGLIDILIEKDYVLDWILWGISQDEYLRNNLVFKGGTALHKMYFPDWRFSEDLDFTSISRVRAVDLKLAILRLIQQVENKSGVGLSLKDIEASGKIGDEWSFEVKIEYVGPRKQTGGNLPTILIHITNDELLIDQPVKKFILRPYEDLPGNPLVMTYSLEEITAEKLRTVFFQRCWPRDIYDLWRLMREVGPVIDLSNLFQILQKKCLYKNIKEIRIPDNIDDRIQRVRKQWQEGLQRQLSSVPDFDLVVLDLKELLRDAFCKFNIFVEGGLEMIESNYLIRYKKGEIEIEVQGDKDFVEEKFKELISLKLTASAKEQAGVTSTPTESGKQLSLVEFIRNKNPKSHGDKILTFGYYLKTFRNFHSFNLDDIEECYREARIPRTKNFSAYITQLIRDGLIMDSEEKKDNKKAWILTNRGIEYVENLNAAGE